MDVLAPLQPLYLVLAGLCLLLAVHSLKNALAPAGLLMRAAAALAIFGLSVGAAVVLLLAALIAG